MDRLLKNNYYDGKHLSTDCFKTEQTYNSAKLAQISQLVFGKGVICGLSVSAMNPYPDTIEISSGAAVDNNGRLITIYNNAILPAMAIEGFKSSVKTHTLRAVYKETQENNDTIAERCVFTYDESEGVELAQITFENGAIKSIRDTKTPVDSQLLKNMAAISASAFENQINDRVAAIFDKYLPDFVKGVNENLEYRLKDISIKNRKDQEESEKKAYRSSIEYTHVMYNVLEKRFEDILNKVNELDEKLEKIKNSSKHRGGR